jgi:hypothetical protein
MVSFGRFSPLGGIRRNCKKGRWTGGIAASRNHQAVERSREFTHSLFNSYSAGCLGTRLLSRSANSVRIARDMGAPSAANPAADRADIVGVAVAAAVASVIHDWAQHRHLSGRCVRLPDRRGFNFQLIRECIRRRPFVALIHQKSKTTRA